MPYLPKAFSAKQERFKDSRFHIKLINKIKPLGEYNKTFGSQELQFFSMVKERNSPFLTISLLVNNSKIKLPKFAITDIVYDSIKEVVFGRTFPRPFIASAERTGSVIFRSDLNFEKMGLISHLSKKDEIDPNDLIGMDYGDYALPVKDNVMFARKLETHSKRQSFIAKTHPDIIEEFGKMIDGKYSVSKKEEIFFQPKIREKS